ncbi:MAG: peptide ABC transporter substrate-binding protein [Acidimicrobiia bacterium]
MRRRLIATVVASALLAGACSSGGGTESGAEGDGEKAFSIAIIEPEHLFPPTTNATNDMQVLFVLFTGLVEYDAQTAEPANAMAESIESSDQQNWTIKIKEDWTFHDGEIVTARSFVDAWNHGAYAPNAAGNSSSFSKIVGYDDLQGDPTATPPVEPAAKEMSGLTVVDETTFTVALKEPFSQFPITLGFQAFYPLPKVALTDQKAFEEAPVGNGPYMMDGRWNHDESIRVKRYDGYKGPTPPADAIEFKIYVAKETAYRDFQAGAVDITTELPSQEIPGAKQEYGERYVEQLSSGLNYLGFPLYEEAYARKEIRQAISLAIDRELIIDKIYDGEKDPARSIVFPALPGTRTDACQVCHLDVARARQLLAQGGGWKGGTLHIWFATGRDHDRAMEAVANQLRDNLGITDVKFDTPEFAVFFGAVKAHEVTGPFRLNWLMDYPSPQAYLAPLFISTSSSNRAGYANPKVDELIAAGDRAPSIEAGLASYQAAEDIILDELPLLPLWFGKNQAVHSERTDKVVIDLLGRVRVEDVTVVG